MFGRPEVIREWRTRHLIDYRLLSAEPEDDTRWLDRLTFEGNLLTAFEQIYPRLVDGQPVPFRLRDGMRIDQGPVQTALREALVNLLVHADYTETQASIILRSPTGYYFRNPGSSRVPENDLWASDRSDPRNPELVHMFRLIGLADEAGTGIPKIIASWRQLGFRLPAIDVGAERYEFTLDLRHAHLISEGDRAWLRALAEDWPEAEQLALVLARHDGEVDNRTLRRLTGQHPADVTKVLGGLRDRGLLRMLGNKRGARYELGGAALPAEPPAAETVRNSTNSGESSTNNVKSSTNRTANSTTSEEAVADGDSGERGSERGPADATVLWPRLEEIAKPAREQSRLDPAMRDTIIVRLCALTPLTLSQLTMLLQRSKNTVRLSLGSLLADGRLTRFYADPNHPRQKYMATEQSVAQEDDSTS